MQDVRFMRDDGCYGWFSQGTGLFGYANDRILDRCMRTAADLDIYVFPDGSVPYGYFFIFDLSGKLVYNFCSACGVLYHCKEEA